MVIADSNVLLQPATVRAGDVYLVLDVPLGGSLSFVAHQETESAPPGPLSSDDLDRLRRGDTIHTATTGVDAGGCSPAQNAEDRGKMGPCGNVLKVVVGPGAYVVVGGSPDPDPQTGELAPLAVLTVVP